ncbi:phosphonatase-like hydrolase [Lacisediminihabitans sp. G11-30]|uniref:Phosphonatase-like hydrolase n=1 Tax=Lacisediminihabitans changchengi TaxID=2787634 RepID=A0A934VXT1_9MICO|nr:phosphonatase-like hydrolase [Lacisediminihabitans changchengi]
MITLVALDMAGTTIDDHGLVYEALAESVRETGATVAASDLQLWMGADKLTAIGALLRLGGGEPADAPAGFERFREILAESYRRTPPIALPGVEDALRTLRGRGVKIALTTGFTDGVAYPILDTVGWQVGDLLDAVVTSSEVAAGRPAPYLIHHAMEKTRVTDVATVLAAGDTVVDLLAARNAGAVGVGVLTGQLTKNELAQHPHDYILESVANLPVLPELS